MMKEFERICKVIEDNGFEVSSRYNATKTIYMNKDKNIHIVVEVDEGQFTEADEERVKERLRALGYLD